MNPTQQLYNAARKYCIDRHAHWCAEYRKLNDREGGRVGFPYSDEAYDKFPRYNALSAILTEIERIDYDNLPSYPVLSELLILAGHIADSAFTKDLLSDIGATAIANEREKFTDAIREFSPASIADNPPLPYRRVLSASEVSSLWGRVQSRWGADRSHFYPLADRTDPSLYAFDSEAFDREFPPSRLQAILRGWKIARIYELRECGDNNYLLSGGAWEPYYDGAEGYWFSDSPDWIMYASHESSITTGGTLTQAVLSEWKDAGQCGWTLHSADPKIAARGHA
jgi:hypothetical protein